jgi:pimeloyl-ACP methyl ester carboxylesterase
VAPLAYLRDQVSNDQVKATEHGDTQKHQARKILHIVLVSIIAGWFVFAPPVYADDPVILLHGFSFNPTAAHAQAEIDAAAMEAAWSVEVHVPWLGIDNYANAYTLSNLVNSLGGKVDIIGQSMGGLSARYYVRNYPLAKYKVDAYIAIGTPHQGESIMCGLLYPLNQQCPTNPFMKGINAGDVTPFQSYGVRYFTFYGDADSSSGLAEACNVYEPGIPHGASPMTQEIKERVRQALSGNVC